MLTQTYFSFSIAVQRIRLNSQIFRNPVDPEKAPIASGELFIIPVVKLGEDRQPTTAAGEITHCCNALQREREVTSISMLPLIVLVMFCDFEYKDYNGGCYSIYLFLIAVCRMQLPQNATIPTNHQHAHHIVDLIVRELIRSFNSSCSFGELQSLC